MLLIAVDQQVQHGGGHVSGGLGAAAPLLHHHGEGVGASSLRRKPVNQEVGALPPPTSAVPDLAQRSMLGNRPAP